MKQSTVEERCFPKRRFVSTVLYGISKLRSRGDTRCHGEHRE